MKLVTAERYIVELNRRLTECQGIYMTPRGSRDGYRFLKIEAFGSTIRGKPEPNDLDILITGEMFGAYKKPPEADIDRAYKRRYGMVISRHSSELALIWLTKGMRKVSRHDVGIEAAVITDRVEIWPSFEYSFRCVP